MRRVRLSPDGGELPGLVAGLTGLLGITGAPGAGKSTLAASIGALTGCPVVPMDGFHLADAELDRRGLRDRKGAPETFDAWGYAALLERLAGRPEHVVMAPGFERGLEQPLAGAVAVEPGWTVLVTEGNYLLLDDPPWAAVRRPLDAVWHVVTEDRLRRERLVARHVASGKSPGAAAAWVARVDQPNAVLVEAAAARADLVLDLTHWSPPVSATGPDGPPARRRALATDVRHLEPARLPVDATGYDGGMSDPKPGPANPAPQGADAPTPPGGPQRQDSPGTSEQPVQAAPGTPDTGQPSPASDSSNPDANAEPVPEPSTEPDTESDPQTDPDAEGRQEENAESSLDQPSDG